MRGLTSLFGMGRGEHPRQNHHKDLRFTIWDLRFGALLNFVHRNSYIVHQIMSYWDCFLTKVHSEKPKKKIKAYGQLVLLGFAVTSFTPVAYQRHSL